MTALLRVIDTGVGGARWNVAMTAALTELHRAGRIPDTLRFHRYRKSVLIGRHQVLTQAANMESCRDRRIEIARRVTGGGAVYMAPGVLAWEFVLAGRGSARRLDDAAAVICGAVAAGLSQLGISAHHRPPNAIEVQGRKVSGASGYFDGPTFVYQGTILIDADMDEMAAVLAPLGGKRQEYVAALQDLVTIADVLRDLPESGQVEWAVTDAAAHALGRNVERDVPRPEEIALAEALLAGEIGTDDFVDGAAPFDVTTVAVPAGSNLRGQAL